MFFVSAGFASFVAATGVPNPEIKLDDSKFNQEFNDAEEFFNGTPFKMKFSFKEFDSDPKSRSVRVYSYPALFHKDSGIIKDLRNMLEKAGPLFKNYDDHYKKGTEIDKEYESVFKELAKDYSNAILPDFESEVGEESCEIAFQVFGEVIGEFLADRNVKVTWWNKTFRKEHMCKIIEQNKAARNVVALSYNLICAINGKKWIDNNFLVTAYDEVIKYREKYYFLGLFERYRDVLCNEWKPASVKFFKSSSKSYPMPPNEELEKRFEGLKNSLMNILDQLGGVISEGVKNVQKEEHNMEFRKIQAKVQEQDDELKELKVENQKQATKLNELEVENQKQATKLNELEAKMDKEFSTLENLVGEINTAIEVTMKNNSNTGEELAREFKITCDMMRALKNELSKEFEAKYNNIGQKLAKVQLESLNHEEDINNLQDLYKKLIPYKNDVLELLESVKTTGESSKALAKKEVAEQLSKMRKQLEESLKNSNFITRSFVGPVLKETFKD